MNELSWDRLLRRYRIDRTDDGLKGSEGVFLWCSFWLVKNLIRLGQLGEARVLYERLLGYRNHLGLFSEMINPSTGEALGNLDLGGLDISSANEVAQRVVQLIEDNMLDYTLIAAKNEYRAKEAGHDYSSCSGLSVASVR